MTIFASLRQRTWLRNPNRQEWWISSGTACFMLVLLTAVGCDRTPSQQPGSFSQGESWLQRATTSPQFESACDETPGCSTTNSNTPVPRESVWRVQVSRAGDGQLRIENISSIDVVAESGVPVGALYSNLSLVGLDGSGDVVDGQPIRFPDAVRIEGEGDVAIQSIGKRRVDTFGYVRRSSDIETIAIQDHVGTLLVRADVPKITAASAFSMASLLGIRTAAAATRPFQGLPPSCSHVIVLQGEQDRNLAAGMEFEDTVTLTVPGPYQLAATEAALRRMTPMLCQSVARIAFGYVPDWDGLLGAVRSVGAGDMILINVSSTLSEESLEDMVNRRLMLQGTIIHEAGHAAETLLTYEGSDPGNYTGAWSFPARSLAASTIDKVRLEMGLADEWQRLHKSFIDQGWAKPYGSMDNDESPENVVHGGFMSRGAAKNWAEDIASVIGHTYMSRSITDAYQVNGVPDSLRDDLGCLVMRTHQNQGLPSRYSALYTKMHFLGDLGLLAVEDIVDCTGEDLGLHVDAPGFHVREWLGSTRVRSFQNQLAAHLGSVSGGTKVFEMTGSGSANFGGKTYPATIELRLDLGGRFTEFDKVSWPRGVYKLGLIGDTNFRLRLDGAPAGDFDAMDGFVLVAESSRDKITGSAVLQRVFRLHAPLPVPELYDPPLVVRFMMEK